MFRSAIRNTFNLQYGWSYVLFLRKKTAIIIYAVSKQLARIVY
jgi:hypothetical protein